MWIADKWNDYEVLDCSDGEKLERWGTYCLVRPDPQVIWKTERVRREWKHPNGHYHRSSRGGGEWEFFSCRNSGRFDMESWYFVSSRLALSILDCFRSRRSTGIGFRRKSARRDVRSRYSIFLPIPGARHWQRRRPEQR